MLQSSSAAPLLPVLGTEQYSREHAPAPFPLESSKQKYGAAKAQTGTVAGGHSELP
jgi:hypothetical protein